MSEKNFIRISISLPQDLLIEFEETAKKLGFDDRSKAIRAALRSLIAESKWMSEERGIVCGALVLIFDHNVKGLSEELTDIQHHYEDIVKSSMHIHLDKNNCLEIIAVTGEAGKIQNLAKALTVRGVKQLKPAITISG